MKMNEVVDSNSQLKYNRWIQSKITILHNDRADNLNHFNTLSYKKEKKKPSRKSSCKNLGFSEKVIGTIE